MEEVIKPAEGQQPSAEGGAGAAPDKTQTDPKDGGGQPSDKKPDDGAAKPTDGQPDPKKPSNEDEPPVRKTKLDFILERKQRRLEKAKSDQIKKVDQELKDAGGNGDDPTGDDDIDPEDAEKISKVIDKKYGHVFEGLEEKEQAAEAEKEEAELQTFITSKPEFKPYEAKIRKFAQHESRKHLPLLSIAYEIAGPDLKRLGAEEERKAAAEAAASTTGGGTTRNDSSHKSIADMTRAEFLAFSNKVRTGEVVLK